MHRRCCPKGSCNKIRSIVHTDVVDRAMLFVFAFNLTIKMRCNTHQTGQPVVRLRHPPELVATDALCLRTACRLRGVGYVHRLYYDGPSSFLRKANKMTHTLGVKLITEDGKSTIKENFALVEKHLLKQCTIRLSLYLFLRNVIPPGRALFVSFYLVNSLCLYGGN